MTRTTTKKPSTRKPRRMAREPVTDSTAASGNAAVEADTRAKPRTEQPHRDGAPSKASTVLAMLERPEGATIEQMVAATGWQPHTTRAVLTGFRNKGYEVTSEKIDGVRTYRATARVEPEAAREQGTAAAKDA